ncbi:MAG: hypothetical protein QN187_16420 [Armatimonadota bacterium]|nr:hypothetical protein [Armatimonadota bacterium]MDR7548667.1 hypothetical protein [Armatimonadota bacterium]
MHARSAAYCDAVYAALGKDYAGEAARLQTLIQQYTRSPGDALFSALGYPMTVPRLRQALEAMSRHLQRGGVVIVEPWITPQAWREGLMHAVFVDQPALKLARMNIGRRNGTMSVLEFHDLVATPGGVESFVERHAVGLFSDEDYLDAFRAAGLDVTYDPEGPSGRGLFIGVRPAGT